jgi:hypothetical protein
MSTGKGVAIAGIWVAVAIMSFAIGLWVFILVGLAILLTILILYSSEIADIISDLL